MLSTVNWCNGSLFCGFNHTYYHLRRELGIAIMPAPSIASVASEMTANGVEAPAPPPHWPKEYVIRRCWICLVHSTEKSPYDQAGDEYRTWQGFIVWDQGTAECPKGNICRLCRTVWSVGEWSTKYSTVAALRAAKRSDPTVLHPFLAERQELVNMKSEHPSVRLRVKGILAAKVQVQMSQLNQSGLEAPPTYFMELWRYRELYGEPDASIIVEETTASGVLWTKGMFSFL